MFPWYSEFPLILVSELEPIGFCFCNNRVLWKKIINSQPNLQPGGPEDHTWFSLSPFEPLGMSNSTRSVILHSDSGRLRSMDNQDAKGHRHRGKDDGALKRRKTEFFPTETLVELFRENFYGDKGYYGWGTWKLVYRERTSISKN